MKRILALALSAMALGYTMPRPAYAAVVVSNLGETILGPVPIGMIGPTLFRRYATSFTTGAGSSWTFNTVTARLSDGTDTFPDTLVLSIFSNSSGSPGSTIGTMNMSANNITGESNYTYPPTAPLALTGNTTYWLVAACTDPFASYGWDATDSTNDNGISGWSIGNEVMFSDNGGPWSVGGDFATMFSINATLLPEPATLGLFGLATATLSYRPSRRQRS